MQSLCRVTAQRFSLSTTGNLFLLQWRRTRHIGIKAAPAEVSTGAKLPRQSRRYRAAISPMLPACIGDFPTHPRRSFTARPPLQTFTPPVSAFYFPIFGFSLRKIKTRHPFRMPRFTVKTRLTCGLSMLPRREALCLRGIRAKHRRRWRYGSSCQQDRISSLRKQSRRRR